MHVAAHVLAQGPRILDSGQMIPVPGLLQLETCCCRFGLDEVRFYGMRGPAEQLRTSTAAQTRVAEHASWPLYCRCRPWYLSRWFLCVYG